MENKKTSEQIILTNMKELCRQLQYYLSSTMQTLGGRLHIYTKCTHVHIHTLIYTHKQIIIKTQYSQGGKWFIMTVVKYHCLTVPTADGKGLFITFNTMENIKKDHQLHYFLSTDMQCSATTPPMR